MVKDRSIEGAIKKALEGRRGRDAEACPDENTLAAYIEMRLDEAQTGAVEIHASNCSSCQETIGLALRLSRPAGRTSDESVEPSSGRRILFQFTLPVSVVALMILAGGAGFFFYRVLKESTPGAKQTAELKLPPHAQGISAAKAPAPGSPREETGTAGKRSSVPKPIPSTPVAGSARHPAVNGKLAEPLPMQETAPPVEREPVSGGLAGAAADRNTTISATQYKSEKPAAPTAEFSRARLAALRSEPSGIIQQTKELSIGIAPSDAVRNLASLQASGREKLARKEVADRAFYQNGGYWIDSQCIEHAAADYMEIKPESAEYETISKLFPGVRPAVVYWNGINYVLK